MSTFAYKTTKWTLDLLTRLTRSNVRAHHYESLSSDMAIIFVVNHFTRLETLLLPYIVHKHTNLEVWSLAAAELFNGRLGSYLRSTGTLSTKDPDRDKIIVRSLLKGDHPWLIFPEGGMIKDKKVVDHHGMFRVYSNGRRRPPHTGAAVLALRSEFYRHKLQCLEGRPPDDRLKRVLDTFALESIAEALQKRTVIVPVNVTYFPIRSRENVVLRAARTLTKDLDPRSLEELSVEGTVLSEETDIDITFGDPIDVSRYLSTPEYAELMACGEHDMEALESDPRSLFNEAARRLMTRYMAEIYRLTTVNHDHLLATIIRYQHAPVFTERAYRNRMFLCAHEMLALGHHRVHEALAEHYRDIIYEEPQPWFDDFIALAEREGVLRRAEEGFRRVFDRTRGEADFNVIRTAQLTEVIANEIEPLALLTGLIKNVSHAPRPVLSQRIRQIFLEEDERLFDEEYDANVQDELSKPRAVGRPFLLSPASTPLAGIVLVHGYLAAPEEVRALADYLVGRGYYVYGVRLRGHGTSPSVLAETPWEAWYESLNRGYAIIKSLTDRIVVGGFSTGGLLALLAGAHKQEKVQALFSINAPLALQNYSARLVSSVVSMNRLLKRFGGRGRWDFVDNAPENPHINYSKNPLNGVVQLERLMRAIEPALAQIVAPTLVIQGSNDPLVNPTSGQLLFDKIATTHKQLSIFSRDRHGIINGDGGDEIFDRIGGFLEWSLRERAAGHSDVFIKVG